MAMEVLAEVVVVVVSGPGAGATRMVCFGPPGRSAAVVPPSVVLMKTSFGGPINIGLK